MTEHEASRTLVKSPPELWAELSDESSLGRHFDQFGEIRITRLEPETAVAWEGERVSGTVRLEPSGWGTKVILTARAEAVVEGRAQEPAVEAVVDETPETVVEPQAAAPAPRAEPLPPAAASTAAPSAARARKGFFGRLFGFLTGTHPEPASAVGPPEPTAEPPVEPPVVAVEPAPVEVAEEVVEPPAPVEAVALEEPFGLEDPRSADSEPESPAEHPIDAAGVLAAALDSLGQAHHRPFSRG